MGRTLRAKETHVALSLKEAASGAAATALRGRAALQQVGPGSRAMGTRWGSSFLFFTGCLIPSGKRTPEPFLGALERSLGHGVALGLGSELPQGESQKWRQLLMGEFATSYV